MGLARHQVHVSPNSVPSDLQFTPIVITRHRINCYSFQPSLLNRNSVRARALNHIQNVATCHSCLLKWAIVESLMQKPPLQPVPNTVFAYIRRRF